MFRLWFLCFCPIFIFAQNYDELLQKGRSYYEQDSLQKAFQYFSEAITKAPERAEALALRSSTAFLLGDHKTALADAQKALKIDKQNSIAYFSIANVLLTEKNFLKAIDYYATVVLLDSTFADAYFNQAWAYQFLDEFDSALYCIEKCLALEPKYEEAMLVKGTILHDKGQHTQAIQQYEELLALNPLHWEAYYEKAVTLTHLNQYIDALEAINKAIALKNDDATMFDYRGAIYAHLQNWEKALLDLSQAIQLNPNYHMAYTNRCFVLLKLGKYQEALKDCEKSIALNPYEGLTYNNRAVIYYELGNMKQACNDWKKAIQLKEVDYAPNNYKTYCK